MSRRTQDVALAVFAVVVLSFAGYAVHSQSGGAEPASSSSSFRNPLPSPTASPTPTAAPTPLPFTRATSGSSRVLFVGDSITGSYFAKTEAGGFRPRTIAALRAGGPVRVVEASKAYATLTTVSSITSVPADLSLAVVELGTNDVGRTNIDAFDRSYAALLGRIRAASPRTALVCMGVWSSSGATYDQVIASECESHRGTFLRLSDLFADKSLHATAGTQTFAGKSDNFHPNDAGHEQIAARLMQAVTAPSATATPTP